MKKRIKWGLVIASLLFIFGISNAYAKTITIDEVINTFNELNIISYDDGGCTEMSLEKGSDGKTLYGMCKDKRIYSFSYTTEYINYLDKIFSAATTDDTASTPGFGDINHYANGIIDSILILSGYENMAIYNDSDYSYAKDGFEITGDVYTGHPTVLTNVRRTAGVLDFNVLVAVRAFQISLDTDKIDSLVSNYGDPYIRDLITLTPTVETNIDGDSATLLPKIDYSISDSSYQYGYYLYECDSENRYDCSAVDYRNAGTPFVITVEKDAVYYYRVILSGSSNYSNLIEVTTKVVEPDPKPNPDPTPTPTPTPTPDPTPDPTPSPEPEKKNPETGAFFPTSFIILLVSGVGILAYTKKKDILK